MEKFLWTVVNSINKLSGLRCASFEKDKDSFTM